MAKIISLFKDPLGTNKLAKTQQCEAPFMQLHQLFSETEIREAKEKGFYQARIIPLPVDPFARKTKKLGNTKVIPLLSIMENINEKLI